MTPEQREKHQRFLNSKLVPPGQLGQGGKGIMSQAEWYDYIKDKEVKSTSNETKS